MAQQQEPDHDLACAKRLEGRVTTVAVTGDIDAFTAPQFSDLLADAAHGAVDRVEVDLSRVGFLDSCGLRALVLGAAAMRQRDIEFDVTAMSGPVRRLLEVSGLDGMMTVGTGRPGSFPASP